MKTTVYGRIAVLLILLMALVGASCDRRIDTANSQGTDAGTDSVGQLDVAGDGFVPTTDTALESDTADALENDTADALENDTADDSSPSLSWCEGTTHYLYAPLDGTQLYTFPDEFFSVADPSTLTSRRVVMDASNAPWIESMPANLRGAFKTANQLDGFGTTAGIVLQFDAPLGENLPTGDDASLTNGTLMLFELGADGAKRIPFDARRIDDGKTLLLFPMLPLRPKTRHGLVLTTKLLAQDGGCIAPSATLKALLDGSATDPRLVPLVPRYAELLKGAALTPAEVSAAVVFTTQSVFEDSLKMAAKIKTLSFSWDGAPACTVSGAVRKCETSFTAGDYRKNGVLAPDDAPTPYSIPVTIWLPATGEGPWPIILWGHGLGGTRHTVEDFGVEQFAPELGIAIVAIDAVAHGDHPGGTAGSSFLNIAKFFGIDVATLSFDPLKQRDNWRQSTLDKLQLLQLLQQQPDFDDDQKPDLNADKMGYIGGSLGSIMAMELLALSDRFEWAITTVGGSRVTSIISEGKAFRDVVNLAVPPSWTDDDLQRLVQLAQAVIDRADSGNYARHILRDRFPVAGNKPPHLLVAMALDDTTVPNVSTLLQVRSIDLPIFEPIFLDPGLVPQGGPLPQSLNWLEGSISAGFFQYDRYTTSPDGPVKKADHVSVHEGREFLLQASHFVETWLKNGTPEIIDPYAILGTPPLPD